jgi:hypothetical protein
MKSSTCLLALTLLPLVPVSAQVVITEFMADNTRTAADEDGS